MFTIEYDSSLVEQATFLAARRDKRLDSDLHAAIDPLYETSDEESRGPAFEAVFREFFAKLGLHRVIANLLDEVPIVGRQVGRCVVREAARTKEESAELFVHSADADAARSERTLVVLVCPQSFIDSGRFDRCLRRELLHVADMLDDRFGYVREAIAGLPARQNLIRDRYRVLWDIYIEGRLDRDGRGSAETAESLERAFSRVFAGHDPLARERAFRQVFDAPALKHGRLLDWARDPAVLFDEEAKPSSWQHPAPGQRCPLCGFPTHDWFEFGADAEGSLAKTIQQNHAGWSAQSGACRQCAEMYAAGAREFHQPGAIPPATRSATG